MKSQNHLTSWGAYKLEEVYSLVARSDLTRKQTWPEWCKSRRPFGAAPLAPPRAPVGHSMAMARLGHGGWDLTKPDRVINPGNEKFAKPWPRACQIMNNVLLTLILYTFSNMFQERLQWKLIQTMFSSNFLEHMQWKQI